MNQTNTVVLVLVLGIPMVVLIWALSKWLNKPRENPSEFQSALRADGSFWLEPEKAEETLAQIPTQEEKKENIAQRTPYPRKVKIWERWIAVFFIIWGFFLVISIIQSDVADFWKRLSFAFNHSTDFMLQIALLVTLVLAMDWAADKAIKVLEISQVRIGILAKIAAITGLQYLWAHWGYIFGLSMSGLDDDVIQMVGRSILIMIGLWLVDKMIRSGFLE
jgi:putative Mn2+ efflux pump MntP